MKHSKDYKLWSSVAIIFCCGTPTRALGNFGALLTNGFSFSHFHSLALSCSIGAVVTLSILSAGFVTRAFLNARYVFVMDVALISLSGTAACWLGPLDNRSDARRFAPDVGAGQRRKFNYFYRLQQYRWAHQKFHSFRYDFRWVLSRQYCGSCALRRFTGPEYGVGFLLSSISMCIVVAIAAAILVLLWMENKKKDRVTGLPQATHAMDEDLTDFKNKDFRYMH